MTEMQEEKTERRPGTRASDRGQVWGGKYAGQSLWMLRFAACNVFCSQCNLEHLYRGINQQRHFSISDKTEMVAVCRRKDTRTKAIKVCGGEVNLYQDTYLDGSECNPEEVFNAAYSLVRNAFAKSRAFENPDGILTKTALSPLGKRIILALDAANIDAIRPLTQEELAIKASNRDARNQRELKAWEAATAGHINETRNRDGYDGYLECLLEGAQKIRNRRPLVGDEQQRKAADTVSSKWFINDVAYRVAIQHPGATPDERLALMPLFIFVMRRKTVFDTQLRQALQWVMSRPSAQHQDIIRKLNADAIIGK